MDGGTAVIEPTKPIAPTLAEIAKRVQTAAAQRRRLFAKQRRENDEMENRARQGHVAPTAQREQHGNLKKFPAIASEDGEPARAGAIMRRVQSPIDRYHKREQITSRQAQAADTLRNDYEFGVCGAHDASKSSGSGGVKGFADLQLDAVTRYRKAWAALGPSARAVVLPVVLGDEGGAEVTVSALAKSRGEKSEQQLMGALKLGLDCLADHYGLPRVSRHPQNRA